MLDEIGKARLKAALDGLRAGDAAGWAALAPLSQLSAEGTEITVDFSTEDQLGAPVIIARPVARLAVGLTARQREVAQVLALGWSNKAIARALGIAPTTVKDHVRAVLAAFGLNSRAEFVAALHTGKTGRAV